MRKEEAAAKSETFKLLFSSGSEIQQRYFCETCERTENRSCSRLRST